MTEQTDANVARAAARAAKKDAILAARTAFDALPATERWTSFERIGQLLHQRQWTFAKTMAHNPHWYTLRRKWISDQDFQWTVAQLRAHGYRAKFREDVVYAARRERPLLLDDGGGQLIGPMGPRAPS